MYKLRKELNYAGGNGDMVLAEFIEVLPPTARNITDIAPIKSEVLKAIHWSQTQSDVEQDDTPKTDDDDDSEMDPAMMMMTLDLAPEVEVAKVILHVRSMLMGKNGLAKVDGEYTFTSPLADALSIEDWYGITGYFLVNFIVPSL